MKKVLSIAIMLTMLISCQQSPFGQGGKNAEQFVKEKTVLISDNIANIEVIKEDSLLSDILLAFDSRILIKAGSDFLQGNISGDDYMKIINDRTLLLKDIQDCWQFPLVVNDSLRKLKKYEGIWRKAYTVKVTMKSGVTKKPRVLMDHDGITPYMIEKDFIKQLSEYENEIGEAIKKYSR